MINWLNRDVWGPIWPNLAASALSFGSAWLLAHRYLLNKWEEREAEHLRQHAETHRLIAELSKRLERKENDHRDLRP